MRRMKNSIIPTLKPLITVKEARKLLGGDCKHMSDTQVQVLIHTLTSMARSYLEKYSSNKALGFDSMKL